MRYLLFLVAMLVAGPSLAAPLPEVEHVVACIDPAATPPDFAGMGCRQMRLREVDPQGRQIWIRAVVEMPPVTTTPIGVRFAAMASSELWWNGVRVGSNGAPGATRAVETAGRMDAMIALPPSLVRAGSNVVVIRLSTWHQPWRVARPIQQIAVERYGEPMLRILRQYLVPLLLAGVFGLAAIYFAAAWLTNRADRGALALTILALATLSQLGFEVSRGLVAYSYPWQEPRLVAILACASAVGLSMIGYAAWHYRRGVAAWWLGGGAMVIAAACTLPIGLDARTALVLALAACGAAAATICGLRQGGAGLRRGLATLAALTTFIGLDALGPDFLDANLYLALALLATVLFGDQIVSLRRAERARAVGEARAAQLELALLRQSIAPHFVLNTLNSLIDWVETDPATGVRMIEILGDEFRTLARVASLPSVPLAEEIALCRGHLALMAFRTDARLGFLVEGDEIGLHTPPGVLLTLVENALVHGRYADGAAFVLGIEREGDALRSLMLTTPPSLSASNVRGTGTGSAYIAARIAEAFGSRARLEAGPVGTAWRTTLFVGDRR